MRTQLPLPKKGAEHPSFSPRLLWPNGCMDQDESWHGGRPRPWPHCVRCEPRSSSPKRHSPQFSAHVYCGQMAGWIQMPLGTEVSLGPGHILLDGDAAHPPKGEQPPPPIVYCGKTTGWIKMPLRMEVGLCPGHIVLDGAQLPC